MENITENFKIRILVIGDIEFIESINQIFLVKLVPKFSLETISNEKQALQRLNHNSYDILLLQDGFSKYNTIRLSTMAYAMSRPTIIICKNAIKQIYYSIYWKHFSKFCRRFKTCKKLIFFAVNDTKHSDLVEYLANNHLQYFETINSEISEKAKL